MLSSPSAEVIIVGAGPVGLGLANYLGISGLKVLVIEQLDKIIDYPRAIGIDDESLRCMQAISVVNDVLPHTTPNHSLRFLTSGGRCFANFQPTTSDFGWSRRNGFVQPEVDQVLFQSLARFPNVEVRFSQKLVSVDQDEKGVTVTTEKQTYSAKYLIGSDGGSSFTRKQLNIAFEGKTAPDPWIVVDIRNDPLGLPNIYVCCDPTRPYVSAALPHSIRRFEFMVMSDETQEHLTEPQNVKKLLAKVLPQPEKVDIIRSRVYTHNARLATRFRSGRVLLAGDAAHIMPVWQGQGYNSGIRDVFNLGWKVARVAKGILNPAILDTYERERRSHAKAMMDLSVLTGQIFCPPYRWLSWLRDGLTWVMDYFPATKRYFLEMKFKPMPRYAAGAALVLEKDPRSPVGTMFVQPLIFKDDDSEKEHKLDDIIGPDNFAIISWGANPISGLNATQLNAWRRLGTTLIEVLPACQLKNLQAADAKEQGVARIGDSRDGRLKQWFGSYPCSIALLRPDRMVGALAIPQTIGDVSDRFMEAIGFIAE